MRRTGLRTAMVALIAVIGMDAYGANVVSRGSGTTTRAPRANNAETRMPTLNSRAQSLSSTPSATTSEPAANADTTPEQPQDPTPTPEITPDDGPVIIENKSSQFDTTLTTTVSDGGTDGNSSDLAEAIRRQRAALDTQSAVNAAQTAAATSLSSGQSECDIGLRQCMQEKCGSDYSKCAGDGDTIWGDKMDACRRNTTCTGHQYQMFAPEIKADRDTNAKLAAYNKIIECGNSYNSCIVEQCGVTYSKCLSKTAENAAIAACEKIAKNCTQQDSGLASRTMNVFGTLRQDAEKTIAADEKRLYEMRDQMRSQCQRLGATFDDRSLVCVFTVNFFAGNSTTPTASKKLYGGSTFDCHPDWFGIDVTTFKENAYRLTRDQTAASSAMLGSGLGQAVGALTSGAVDRAIDRQKAENAVKQAEKEHEANYGDKDAASNNVPKTNNNTDTDDAPASDATNNNASDSTKAQNQAAAQRQKNSDKIDEKISAGTQAPGTNAIKAAENISATIRPLPTTAQTSSNSSTAGGDKK